MKLRPEVQRQTALLSVRMYDAEYAVIQKAAKTQGITVAGYARKHLVGLAQRHTKRAKA